MARYLLLQIAFIKWTKSQSTWHLYKQWLYKVYEDYIEFIKEQAENMKITERWKTGFPKE